jgi:hypothetical protein
MLMLGAVGLSAWLNYEHGLLLHYPEAVRVLFASPAVISCHSSSGSCEACIGADCTNWAA